MLVELLRGRRLTTALGAGTALALAGAAGTARLRPGHARTALALGAATLGGLTGIGWWAHLVEPRLVETSFTRLPWDGPPLRLVLLSDLHVRAGDGPRIERIVRRTLALAPDVVLFAGDAIDDLDLTADKLAALAPLVGLRGRPPLGLHGVLGNHDAEPSDGDAAAPVSSEKKARIRARLEAAGFRILENERVTLRGGVTLIGLGDWRTHGTDARPAFDGADPRRPTIVLAHAARSLEMPGVGRFSIALAGHTHGGQGCIPFTGICPFLADDMKPYRAGLYDWPGGGRLYVGRGIGTSDVRARLGARPELPVIDLYRADPTGRTS